MRITNNNYIPKIKQYNTNSNHKALNFNQSYKKDKYPIIDSFDEKPKKSLWERFCDFISYVN